VHLRPYELNAEIVERLGASLQERAVVAARRYYRGGVTVDVHIEEGSAKFWITLGGALSALHIGYGIVADYRFQREH